jgi:hypothetical protein
MQKGNSHPNITTTKLTIAILSFLLKLIREPFYFLNDKTLILLIIIAIIHFNHVVCHENQNQFEICLFESYYRFLKFLVNIFIEYKNSGKIYFGKLTVNCKN